MKELILPLVAITALCLGGCDRDDRADHADEQDLGTVTPRAEPSAAATRDEARPSTPAGVDVSIDVSKEHAPAADPAVRDGQAGTQPTTPGTPAAEGSSTRAEFVAASRRRLEQLDRELQQLESRSRESGKQLRAEIRAEKRKLDADLERMDKESEQVWTDMKAGFADALERLETELRQVRKDIDPDA